MNIAVFNLLGFLALGAAFAFAFLGALEWNVRLYCGLSGGRLAFFIHALRWVGAAVVFTAAAKFGPGALLSVLIGFQLAKVYTVLGRALTEGAAR